MTEIAFKGIKIDFDDYGPNKIQAAATALVEALKMSVFPGSMELHFSSDGQLQKIDIHAVGWKRATKT